MPLTLILGLLAPTHLATAVNSVVNLAVTLTVPVSGSAFSSFSDKLVITNYGPATSKNSTFTVTMPDGAKKVSVSANVPDPGASAAEEIKVTDRSISGTIGNLPAGSSVTLTIQGNFGSANSATVTATVTPGPDETDSDQVGNTTKQSTAVTGIIGSADVSVSVDKDKVASGESHVITTTIKNLGDIDLPNLYVDIENAASSIRGTYV
ncbi:MAG: hypothetical protein ACRDAX_00225, partial [Propionibacteriaceae bacterium]